MYHQPELFNLTSMYHTPIACLLTNRARLFGPGLASDTSFTPVDDTPAMRDLRHLLDVVHPRANEYGLRRLLSPMVSHPLVRERAGRHLIHSVPPAFLRLPDMFTGGELVADHYLPPSIARVPVENPVVFEMTLRREADGVGVFTYGNRRVFVGLTEQSPQSEIQVDWPEDAGIQGRVRVDDFGAWLSGDLVFSVDHVPVQAAYASWVPEVLDAVLIPGTSRRAPAQEVLRDEGLLEAALSESCADNQLAVLGLSLALATWRRLPSHMQVAS